MVLVDLAVLIFYSVQIFALDSNLPKHYAGDFVFPIEKSEDFSSCTFKNGTVGRCVSVLECPNAGDEYRLGINPTLCHFNREPIVCCLTELVDFPIIDLFVDTTTEQSGSLNDLTQRRISAAKCDEFYSSGTLLTNALVGTVPSASASLANVPSTNVPLDSASLGDVPSTNVPLDSASLGDVPSTNVPLDSASLGDLPIDDTVGQFHITVVGGTDTFVGEFPHMAALGWTDENKKLNWRCGGTLISDDFVLTAAHCVIGITPPDTVRIGEKDLTNTNVFSLPQDFGIESITGHPNYRSGQFYDDIALIKLNQSVIITPRVRPACLWQKNEINFPNVEAIGYGHTEFGGMASNKLLKVDLQIFNSDECALGYQSERSLRNGIMDSQVCAGDSTGEKDTCQGDSGGPLQVSTLNEGENVFHVVGVTSFGKACATTLPGVYTRVSHYLEWIENIVWR